MSTAQATHINSNWSTGVFEHHEIDAKLRCSSYEGRSVTTDKDTLYAVGYGSSWNSYLQMWNKFTFEPLKRIEGLLGHDGIGSVNLYDDRIVWFESCGAGASCAIADKIQGTVIAQFDSPRSLFLDSKVVMSMNTTFVEEHDLHIRSIIDGSIIQSLPIQNEESTSTGIAFKDNLIIVGYESGKIRVWNKLDGSCEKILSQDFVKDPVRGIVCEGNKIIATYKSGALLFWDLESESVLKELHSKAGSDLYPHLKIEGSLLIIKNDKTLDIWNLETDICVSSSQSNYYLITEKHIVLAGPTGEIKFISKEDGSLLKSLDGHEEAKITSILRKDDILITADNKEQIKFWNIHSGEFYHSLSGGRYPYLDGSRLFAHSEANEGCINIWDFKES